jgi:hypothetical protein
MAAAFDDFAAASPDAIDLCIAKMLSTKLPSNDVAQKPT